MLRGRRLNGYHSLHFRSSVEADIHSSGGTSLDRCAAELRPVKRNRRCVPYDHCVTWPTARPYPYL